MRLPSDFGEGGRNLSPNGASGTPSLQTQLDHLGAPPDPPTTTTNATPTVARSYAVPANAVLTLKCLFLARRSNGAERAVYDRTYVFYRTASGNVTLAVPAVAWPAPYYESAGASAWDVSANANTTSQTAELLVTGEAGVTIVWDVAVVRTLNGDTTS